MNNKVIEVLDREHGNKVMAYFRSKGVDTYAYSGEFTKAKNNPYRYYGVVDGEFTNYSLQQIKYNRAQIITLPTDLSLPRLVEVSNSGNDWNIRTLIAILPDYCEYKYITLLEGRTIENNNGHITEYRYIREISQPEEMTLSQVCKELGRDIKIVK